MKMLLSALIASLAFASAAEARCSWINDKLFCRETDLNGFARNRMYTPPLPDRNPMRVPPMAGSGFNHPLPTPMAPQAPHFGGTIPN